MLNAESTLWKVMAYNDGYAHIIQKSSGAMKTVRRSILPSTNSLAMMNEVTFNRTLREAFHG